MLAELVDELSDTDERQTAMVVAHGGTISRVDGLDARLAGVGVALVAAAAQLRWAVLEQRFDRWRLRAWGLAAA